MSVASARTSRQPNVIRAEGITKVFYPQHWGRTLFRVFTKSFTDSGDGRRAVVALDRIDMEVSRGERIGIIGDNGSGKTTLLKVVAGLYPHSGGRLDVNGAVILLRGLNIGMVDELTARDSVLLYGALYGLSGKAMKEKFDDIFEWAELQPYVDAKFGTLSSGMQGRLAFSALRHFDADIFLLDEAFTAVDKRFRRKYEEVLQQQKGSDRTFLVATHDLSFARTFCTKALWLHQGKQMAFGPTRKVLQQYSQFNGD